MTRSVILFSIVATHLVAAAAVADVRRDMSTQKLNNLQVPFVTNQGQTDSRVKFYAKTFWGTAYVTRGGEMVYALPKGQGKEGLTGWSLKEKFIGARIGSVEGRETTGTRVSYFLGNDQSKWKTNIPTYESVTMGGVYNSIDLKLRAYGANFEKIFSVHPGARPEQIRVRISGAQSLKTNENGELEAQTGLGTVVFTRPRAYQTHAGRRNEVEVAYTTNGESYGFRVGKYDKTRELVIDPLIQTTYLGGSDFDVVHAIGVSQRGVYVLGSTLSMDFPATIGGAQSANGGLPDAFVALLNSDLTTLIQATYFGGSGLEGTGAMAVSESGVYVTGATTSADLPKTTGGAQPASGGGTEGFVALLTPDLKTLTQATYLGGSGNDQAFAMAVSGADVFVTGFTNSTNFPGTAEGNQPANAGGDDAFVVALSSDLRTLIGATYLGGTEDDQAHAIGVSPGFVYITGQTESFDFPKTSGGAQAFKSFPPSDGFVALLTSDLTTLIQSTYLGGFEADSAWAIAVSGEGIYVAGETASTNFHGTAGGAQLDNGGGTDGFVALLSPDLTSLIQATYLGGGGADRALAIAVGQSSFRAPLCMWEG